MVEPGELCGYFEKERVKAISKTIIFWIQMRHFSYNYYKDFIIGMNLT